MLFGVISFEVCHIFGAHQWQFHRKTEYEGEKTNSLIYDNRKVMLFLQKDALNSRKMLKRCAVPEKKAKVVPVLLQGVQFEEKCKDK